MEISNIKSEDSIIKAKSGVSILKKTYTYIDEDSTPAKADEFHRLTAFYTADELLAMLPEKPENFSIKESSFYRNGWQSWDAGWEIAPDEKGPQYKSFLMPALKTYIQVPETIFSKNEELAQFITYFRCGSTYVVLASTGNTKTETPLPPVQYRYDRENSTITIETYAVGKVWKNDEKIAEICFFCCNDFFALKDTISELYKTDRFENLSFLGKKPGGWESWYNHYNKIDENLILEDLETLGNTDNLIKLQYIDKKEPVIFQIDDGWQQGPGQWEINTERFPNGLKSVTDKIKNAGYIPGLWMAPFVIDLRTDFAKKHPDWILRGKNGKPVPAGFNVPWGAAYGKDQPAWPHTYFVLDISRDDVLAHIDRLIERAIEEWGFRYLKLDFLFTGMLYGCFANGGAAYQWYDRAVKTLTVRTTAKNGDRVAYLGCGMPFESSFNCFPLSRIGADTKEDWDYPALKMLDFPGRPSAYVSMKDTLSHAFWNNAVYMNDPDVVFLRNDNCTLTEDEKLSVALVNYLFAAQIMHSDDPVKFNAETDLPLTKKVISLYELFEKEEFGSICLETDIYGIFSKSKKYAGIVNLSESDYTFSADTFLKSITENELSFETAEGTIKCVKPHCICIYETKE